MAQNCYTTGMGLTYLIQFYARVIPTVAVARLWCYLQCVEQFYSSSY